MFLINTRTSFWEPSKASTSYKTYGYSSCQPVKENSLERPPQVYLFQDINEQYLFVNINRGNNNEVVIIIIVFRHRNAG